MNFELFSQHLEKINQTSSRLEITQLLAELLTHASPLEAQIICYLSLGLLRAPYKGTQFALADKSIKKTLAEFLNLDIAIIEQQEKSLGDLGLVLLENKSDSFNSDHLTLSQVYEQLLLLEESSGTGSQEAKREIVKSILANLSPLSGSFILRIILGKLRLGFSEMTIIDALSWMLANNKSLSVKIESAYNLCADIGLIAYSLKASGLEALEEININLGIPIRPAAAERASTAQEVIKRMPIACAQPKIDGFRLQIHKSNNNIKFFSRNLLDMSQMFPDLTEKLLELPADNYIIEGEAIVYEEQTETFLPFQHTIKRKRKHDVESLAKEIPLVFFIFDILYHNGLSLLDLTHLERRHKLIELFGPPQNKAISVISELEVSNAQQLEGYFLSCLLKGFEGLVVKKPDSIYQAGKRNFNWIKLKRKEGTKLQDSIDAVILGYYAGKGKRASFGIGAFLVGIYDSQTDSFKTIAKIGTGLTDDEWRLIKAKCDEFVVAEPPKNVFCNQLLFPSVWVAPKIVCEIQADELTSSPTHTAGVALRFPRFIKLREDKLPEQTTSIEELKSLSS